jgi:hypothetical protein
MNGPHYSAPGAGSPAMALQDPVIHLTEDKIIIFVDELGDMMLRYARC